MILKSILTKEYVFRSLFWGFFMFVFMGVLVPLSQDESLQISILLVKLIYWIAGGFLCMLIIDMVNKRLSPSRDVRK